MSTEPEKSTAPDAPGSTIAESTDPQAASIPVAPVRACYVSINACASLLHVSRRTVYNWITMGRLRTIRTAGGAQRVLVASMPTHPMRYVRWKRP